MKIYMAQKNTKKILLALFVFIFGAFVFTNAFAQDFTQEDYNKILEDFYNKASSMVQQKTNDFQINLSPEYPEAYTEVTANIVSYSFDADKSYITWTLNGKIIKQGRGKKSVTFKTGGVGTTKYLAVSITTEKGINIRAEKEIKISEIDLLWQAHTFTPAFYKGKAMPVENGLVKVTAIPHGLGASKSLIYEWQRDFKNLPNSSGLGRNSISFSFSDVTNEETISVKVSTTNGNNIVEKTINIRIKDMEVVLYEESPLEGVLYQKALGNKVQLLQPEIVIRAEPYFFQKSDIDSLTYEWRMNQKPIKSLAKPNTIGLSAPSDLTEGATAITLQVKNKNKYFQQITKSLQLSF